MNSEKEFKEALNEKLGSKEFQFDEANWAHAKDMIDAMRANKKKRPFPFFILGGALLLVSVSCYYIYDSIVSDSSSNKIVATNTTPQIKTQEAIEEPTQNLISNEESKVNLKVSEKTDNNETKIEDSEKSSSIIAEADSKSELKTNIPNSKVVAPSSVNQNHSTSKSLTKNKNKAKNNSNSTIKSSVAVPVKSKNAASVYSENKSEAQKENSVVKHEESSTEIKIELPKSITPENIVKPELISVSTDAVINMTDSAKNIVALETPKKDSLPKQIVKEPVHFISFEAGTNYLFGWNNPEKKDANGFNPVVGLNYSNLISKKATLSFGIHYTMVRNLSYSNYTVKSTRYVFGEESDVMVFTPTTMHYLVAPIRLAYAMDSKNSFGLGYTIGYLLNVNSNVELYNQKASQKGNSTVLKTTGYTQGFKTFDSQLSLFYRRNLRKDFWLNAEFIYGLTDIKDNVFFNSNVKEKNVGAKITLIYNLFKK